MASHGQLYFRSHQSLDLQTNLDRQLDSEYDQDLLQETTDDKMIHLIASYVSRWGNSSSIALFDPSCQYFTTPGIEGAIGYREVGACIIVLGDPLCAFEDIPALISIFHRHFSEQRVLYVATSRPFTDWAMRNGCRAKIEVGDELLLDPVLDRSKVKGEARLVRQKASQATRAGVVIREYTKHNPATQQAIEAVGQEWIDSRRGPQIYLAHVYLFCTHVGRRWFYAEKDGKIIGVLLLNRLEKREGWLINLVLVPPGAPNGITELLAVSVLDALATEGCRLLSIGMLTADKLGEMTGFTESTTWLARNVYKLSIKMFGLDKRRKYWEKFKPRKEPSYLLFREPYLGPKELYGLMRAMNVGIGI
jgi:lysylphosphatidylglycerol synthetase-like protein (DUF2156 family)